MTFAAAQLVCPEKVSPMPIGEQGQGGFTYLGLLIIIVFFSMGLIGESRLLASTEKADREEQLLFVGHQFRNAFKSYATTGPGAGVYPNSLEDLLSDPRSPEIKRHLRKIYIDPMTGNNQWGLIKAPEGGVMGVYSLSSKEPSKRANFPTEDVDIEQFVQQKLQNQNQNPNSDSSLSTLTTLNKGTTQNQPPNSPYSLNPSATLSPLVSSVQMQGIDQTAYSFQDWKFIYRPGGTAGVAIPSTSTTNTLKVGGGSMSN